MNQVEKKFTCKRMFQIISKKCIDLSNEDELIKRKYDAELVISPQKVHSLIKEKKVKLRVKVSTKHQGIEALYDLSKFILTKKQLLKKYNMILSSTGNSYTYTYKYLINPMNDNDRSSYQFYTKTQLAKFYKAQKALNKAVEKVMLGSSEEALEAITSLEEMKF